MHGNSTIAINDGTEDVSGKYGTWRRWRIWKVPTGDDVPRGGTCEASWRDDNASKIPNWTDIPGLIFAEGLAGMPERRTLLEFVVAVEGHPEFGAVYFFVILNTSSHRYRVQMSGAKSVRFADWDTIKATLAPWSADSRCEITISSSWLPA